MAYGSVNADTLVTSTSGGIIGAGNASLLKNRLINGAMVISQRNGTTAVSNSANTYNLDRWAAFGNNASKYTTAQSSTAPAGFSNSQLVTSSSAYSVSAGDYNFLVQKVEGYNIADLGWGTANAKTVTLSFWVQSSLTGTFGGSILNGGFTYSYPFTYSIPVANTWTQISVTVAGPTSGTFPTDNSAGLAVTFNLGTGATASGTAGSWSANQYFSATGATSVVGTNGATFYITGVQLEVGSSATGFEYVNYQTSLANCQRYYETIGADGAAGLLAPQGYGTAGVQINQTIFFKVTKRATPTVTKVGTWNLVNLSGQPNIYGNGVDSVLFYQTASGTGGAYAQNTSGAYITLSAEL